MKKFALVILLTLFGLASCEKDPKKEVIVVETLELSEYNLVLKPQETTLLTVTVKPENATEVVVKWLSSDPKVVTVEEGKITAIAIGKATVTASVGDVKATCEIEVKEVVVLPKAKVNDFYYSDGTWSSTLNKDKECVGIVFAVDFDRSSMRNPTATLEKPFPPYVNDPSKPDLKNLVVGLEDLGDITVWDSRILKTGATNWFNGSENMSAAGIADNLDKLPPFKRILDIRTQGQEWYLPSACELLELICVFNGQPSWVFGQTASFPFGENAKEEQVFAAFKQQRDAFNARLIEAGGEDAGIYDKRAMLVGYADVPEYQGDTNDKEALEKWDNEVWNPWIAANPGYFAALEEQFQESRKLSYWSSTAMDKYAPDKDYYEAAISFNSVDPNFKLFSFKTNLSKVRPILAF